MEKNPKLWHNNTIMERQNCIDVIKPFAAALSVEKRCGTCYMPQSFGCRMPNSLVSEVHIIGGVNTVALENDDTIINIKDKEVIASPNLSLSTQRDDGTLRDLDILVHSDHEFAIEYVKRIAERTVGDALDLSVFGFKREEVLRQQMSHPLGFYAMKTFLSDRYCIGENGSQKIVKSLFPFEAPVDPASLETWTLTVGESHIPIPNPAISVINYTNRSIGGMRPKDRDKIDRVAKSVFTKAPELREWASHGPGKSQAELGGLLRWLTPHNDHPNYFSIRNRPMSHSELAEHEFFMFPNLSHEKKLRLVGIAALKAGILSFGESNPLVVSIWQRHVERRIDTIVKNQ